MAAGVSHRRVSWCPMPSSPTCWWHRISPTPWQKDGKKELSDDYQWAGICKRLEVEAKHCTIIKKATPGFDNWMLPFCLADETLKLAEQTEINTSKRERVIFVPVNEAKMEGMIYAGN